MRVFLLLCILGVALGVNVELRGKLSEGSTEMTTTGSYPGVCFGVKCTGVCYYKKTDNSKAFVCNEFGMVASADKLFAMENEMKGLVTCASIADCKESYCKRYPEATECRLNKLSKACVDAECDGTCYYTITSKGRMFMCENGSDFASNMSQIFVQPGPLGKSGKREPVKCDTRRAGGDCQFIHCSQQSNSADLPECRTM